MSEAHEDGRHESTSSVDRMYWARACYACAEMWDQRTGLPKLPPEQSNEE